MVKSWTGSAFNQVPHSANEIHGDKVAKDFGFKGGLVPGVTVSAYLMHPAVEAWGQDFLTRGHSHVKVGPPLYDGESFQADIIARADSGTDSAVFSSKLIRPDGTVRAPA